MRADVATRLAELHRELADVYASIATAEPVDDRVVGLAEAMQRLGCSRSWLERRSAWQKVGGFKGPDGHVRFALSALARYANAQKH